jgi:erythromycin esterase-like protein
MDPSIEELRRLAHPLSTFDPDAPDDELEMLGEVVGDARVVLIGESMHRVHEFLDVRHRLARHLVRQLGFTTFAMESGVPEGRRVDDWMHGRTSERPRDVLHGGITYHFGKCQELLDQLAWMRQVNTMGRSGANGGSAGATRVNFAGIDIPASAGSARPAVEACLPTLDAVDRAYADVVRARLLPLYDELPAASDGLAAVAPLIQGYLAQPDTWRFELTARINGLTERLLAMRVSYEAAAASHPGLGTKDAAAGDAVDVDFAIRCAVTARHADAFLSAMAEGAGRRHPPANIRDLAMAENVLHLVARGERVVVGAANGHVQRVPFHAPPMVPEPMTTMGEHLAAELGDDLVVIGSAYGGGTAWLHRPEPGAEPGHSTPFIDELEAPMPTSLDAVLSTARLPRYLLDLRRVPDGPLRERLAAATGTMNGPYEVRGGPLDAFDAVVYADHISPWHTWIDERGLTPDGR